MKVTNCSWHRKFRNLCKFAARDLSIQLHHSLAFKSTAAAAAAGTAMATATAPVPPDERA